MASYSYPDYTYQSTSEGQPSAHSHAQGSATLATEGGKMTDDTSSEVFNSFWRSLKEHELNSWDEFQEFVKPQDPACLYNPDHDKVYAMVKFINWYKTTSTGSKYPERFRQLEGMLPATLSDPHIPAGVPLTYHGYGSSLGSGVPSDSLPSYEEATRSASATQSDNRRATTSEASPKQSKEKKRHRLMPIFGRQR
nr:uncharacterized protein CI109_002539 [Kwoniella shandongensis]KAA5529198.1 hypothetical protein CI109_002539 [Kwoniella shandongensis]